METPQAFQTNPIDRTKEWKDYETKWAKENMDPLRSVTTEQDGTMVSVFQGIEEYRETWEI